MSGFWEFGESATGGQGSRSDIMQCKRMLDDGASDHEIAEACWKPWTKYFKAFEVYRRISTPDRDWKTQVYVFWGQSGTGKSRLAKWICSSSSTYWKSPNSSWFDGYSGEENIILDDFYGSLPYSTILRLLDRTELRLESKGGHVNIIPKRIFITSNKQPSEWYDGAKCPLDALLRRIEHIVYFMCDNQRTLIKGPALPVFWHGWEDLAPQVHLVNEKGDVLYPQSAEDQMRKHFEATELRTQDFGDFTTDYTTDENNNCEFVGPGYTTEEYEYDMEFPDGTGKKNCIDLTDE